MNTLQQNNKLYTAIASSYMSCDYKNFSIILPRNSNRYNGTMMNQTVSNICSSNLLTGNIISRHSCMEKWKSTGHIE